MNLFEKLTTINRKIIFLILAIVVIIPLLVSVPQTVRVMPPVEKIYNALDTIHQDRALMMDFEYDPQTQAEIEPMALAILRHAFEKRIKVIVMCLYVQPLGLAKSALDQITAEYNEKARSHADSLIYGRDYVFLGWQAGFYIPILGMGESIANVYKVDYYGNKTDTLPLMKKIRNYKNVELLVSLSSSDIPLYWLAYAQNRFGLAVTAGVTSVSAGDFYPYLQSGQFTGLMVGMKGAAEYEELITQRLNIHQKRKAGEALPSITFAHLTIMVFIVIGNIGFFVKRRKR
jgi:hypothetical protein